MATNSANMGASLYADITGAVVGSVEGAAVVASGAVVAAGSGVAVGCAQAAATVAAPVSAATLTKSRRVTFCISNSLKLWPTINFFSKQTITFTI